MTDLAVTINPPADLAPAEVYAAVYEELGVWPTLSGVTRGGVPPDLVVYVSMALSAIGGALANEAASQTVEALKRAVTRLVTRGRGEPDRALRMTDEATGVVFVLDTAEARSAEALRVMVRPDGWSYDPGTELRWDTGAGIWCPGRAPSGPS